MGRAKEERHHCVHRAGLGKDGNKIDISADSIKSPVASSKHLVNSVEIVVEKIPETEVNLFKA